MPIFFICSTHTILAILLQYNAPVAHQAGFYGYIQCCIGQIFVAQEIKCRGQCNDFCMCGANHLIFLPVIAACNNFIVHDYDGRLPALRLRRKPFVLLLKQVAYNGDQTCGKGKREVTSRKCITGI